VISLSLSLSLRPHSLLIRTLRTRLASSAAAALGEMSTIKNFNDDGLSTSS
jgi:hypothetical protein